MSEFVSADVLDWARDLAMIRRMLSLKATLQADTSLSVQPGIVVPLVKGAGSGPRAGPCAGLGRCPDSADIGHRATGSLQGL